MLLKGSSAEAWMDAPVVQLPTDALRITDESSASPQAYLATSYDLSSRQSDVGLLQVPGSPPPISCAASHIHCSSFCHAQ